MNTVYPLLTRFMKPGAAMPTPSEVLDLIEHPKTPSAEVLTSFLYWSYYILRHQLGPKAGLYGPQKGLPYLKYLERQILKASKRSGEVKAKPVPQIKVEDLSGNLFQETFLKQNFPVVIRGMAKDWEAVKRWSPNFFKEKYGKEVIPVRVKADKLDDSGLKIADKTVTELVDNINAGGNFFGANMEDIFNHNPELRDALDLKTLKDYACQHKNSKVSSTQIFMSGGGVKSGFHCTGGINLFVMVYGKKEWTMVSPQFSMWMQPVTRKDMFYAASYLDWKAPYEVQEKQGFPLYRYVPKYVTVLEPGDVLFSPQWWWHAVDTPEPAIGVATRAINKFIFGNPVFSWIWVTSKEFRRLFFHFVKTGWGTDQVSGARLAFEEDFVNKVTH